MLTCSKQGLPKMAMVFDEDVDIWDDSRIAQCMAFRYMPDRDTLIIPQCNTMSTDPKIGDVDKPFYASKIGLDCTIPMVGNWDRHDFDWSAAVDLGEPPAGIRPMTEDALVTDMTSFLQEAPRSWKEILQKYHGQPYATIYRAFGRLTLGQEWSGYAGKLSDDLERIEAALPGVYRLALGGTAVGTGINSAPGFAEAAAAEITKLTGLPFVTAPNKFTVQGAHDALVQLSGTLRTLAVSLYKIANDIRLMSCGPRAGFAELSIPENEPGSSIMPGKVNPTQCEALAMIAVQVMADDVAVGFGGAGGYLEMNVYKPLMIFNLTHSITIFTDGCVNFRKFLVEGTKPNLKKINEYVERSLMLVTALSPVIGYDKASKIAHYAMDNDLTLKAAALKLGFVTEAEFDRVVDPKKNGEALCGSCIGECRCSVSAETNVEPKENDMTTTKHGIDLLQDPSLNKSTAFTEAEKQALGIVGLVPDVTETQDLQLSRVMMQLGHRSTDLDKYIYLVNLLATMRSSSIGPLCPIQLGFCRSFMIRQSAKPVSSSVTSTGRHAACTCR
jgi:Lyase/Fumarase C C-terminus/3-octaprenyl-4-hydroxybenzoate carboxy-lyase